MEAIELELDNSAGAMDDMMSVASAGTVLIDNVMMDDDFSNELMEHRLRYSSSPPSNMKQQQNMSKFRIEHAMATVDGDFNQATAPQNELSPPFQNSLSPNPNTNPNPNLNTNLNTNSDSNSNSNQNNSNQIANDNSNNNKRGGSNRRFSMPNKLSTITENNSTHSLLNNAKTSMTPPLNMPSNMYQNGIYNNNTNIQSPIHSLSANNSPGMLQAHLNPSPQSHSHSTVNVNLNNLNHLNNVIMNRNLSAPYADISRSHPLYDELVRARKKIDELEAQLKKKEKQISNCTYFLVVCSFCFFFFFFIEQWNDPCTRPVESVAFGSGLVLCFLVVFELFDTHIYVV